MHNEKNKQYTPSMHPSGPKTVPAGQMLHFMPPIPCLHTHLPVICSQSSRTDPYWSQAQAEEKKNIDETEYMCLIRCAANKKFFL